MRAAEAIPSRPALRWHGGKWLLAPWIHEHLPKHRVYVEPFGGAASVLLRKKRSYAEVYNDLDVEVVNLFRVLQSRSAELHTLLRLTPFARDEFNLRNIIGAVMPFRPTEHLKGKFYWPVEHYSVPADDLCYHFQEEMFDCPCVKPSGHAGKHEYVFSPVIKPHSHKMKQAG